MLQRIGPRAGHRARRPRGRHRRDRPRPPDQAPAGGDALGLVLTGGYRPRRRSSTRSATPTCSRRSSARTRTRSRPRSTTCWSRPTSPTSGRSRRSRRSSGSTCSSTGCSRRGRRPRRRRLDRPRTRAVRRPGAAVGSCQMSPGVLGAATRGHRAPADIRRVRRGTLRLRIDADVAFDRVGTPARPPAGGRPARRWRVGRDAPPPAPSHRRALRPGRAGVAVGAAPERGRLHRIERAACAITRDRDQLAARSAARRATGAARHDGRGHAAGCRIDARTGCRPPCRPLARLSPGRPTSRRATRRPADVARREPAPLAARARVDGPIHCPSPRAVRRAEHRTAPARCRPSLEGRADQGRHRSPTPSCRVGRDRRVERAWHRPWPGPTAASAMRTQGDQREAGGCGAAWRWTSRASGRQPSVHLRARLGPGPSASELVVDEPGRPEAHGERQQRRPSTTSSSASVASSATDT